MTRKAKRADWWAIVRSRETARKTYHYLNVAGKHDRHVVVTTAGAQQTRGAFMMCIDCRSNVCEHALFVAECVTMGVTSLGTAAPPDAAPLPDTPPDDLEQWSILHEEDR